MPTRVFANVPATVRELWLPTRSFGDSDYIVFGPERLTYAQAHAAADAVATWLLANGVAPGDRVAIAMRNYPEWTVAYWACLSIGICVVGINAWWTGAEIGYTLADSTPKLIFCDRERMERIRSHAPAARLVVTRADELPERVTDWRDVVAAGGAMPTVEIDPEDDACIFYTSGATGVAKGAVLTHRNCVTNIYNIMFAAQAQAQGLAVRRGTGAPAPAARPVTLIPTCLVPGFGGLDLR